MATPTVFSGTVTTTGSNTASVPVYLGDVGSNVNCLVAVTAVSGAGATLQVNLQWSWDGSTWTTGNSSEVLSPFTTVSSQLLTVPSRGLYFRAQWAAPTGTTPSFTVTMALWS